MAYTQNKAVKCDFDNKNYNERYTQKSYTALALCLSTLYFYYSNRPFT